MKGGDQSLNDIYISTFNDGSSSLSEVAKRFGLELATFSRIFLTARD